jgi:alkylation response protein AidB-like acyl-CoA dehydrogenase
MLTDDPLFGIAGAELAVDPELAAFRAEIRAFCKAELPPDILAKMMLGLDVEREDHVRWQKILQKRNYMAGHWPREHGGLGWSRVQRYVFEDEVYRAGSPWLIPFGPIYVAPVIYTYGNEDQKRRFLKPTADSDMLWAQGYSEPEAGSDLAHLKARAVRDGDDYIVTGQKTWTTFANWADWIFILARTDPDAKAQHGISFLLVDMKSPGITVRPIVTIEKAHHINEVFFDSVRVPAANLIGEEGRGWTYAKFLLNNERLLSADTGGVRWLTARLRRVLEEVQEGGAPLIERPLWRRRLAELDARLLGLEAICFEMLARAERGEDPGAAASMLKILCPEIVQHIEMHTIDALASGGLPYQTEALHGGWNGYRSGPVVTTGATREYLHDRASTIYGGSSEIQRNILAKAMLGL